MHKKTPYHHYFLHYHLMGKEVVIAKQQEQAFYVCIDGQWWMLRSIKHEELAVGMKVRIVGLQGCHLQVEKI